LTSNGTAVNDHGRGLVHQQARGGDRRRPEAQVLRFRDELLDQHASDHVDLVFSNAGVAGGASFVKDSRQEWERTFAINWQGVYFCARTFLPLLIASGDGVLVNTSSVAGFWATAGSGAPITAYCTSNFAIKGFSEALIEDLRSHAPQVRVVVVAVKAADCKTPAQPTRTAQPNFNSECRRIQMP
jgi:NAD(P)-dependent dehydrogenase (short-subunit alcohol dehydrogenase family)